MSSLGKITSTKHVLFMCCDIQEVFRDKIQFYNDVIDTGCTIMKIAEVFSIPVILTEQYPEKLGHTVHEIFSSRKDHGKNVKIIGKTKFSMVTEEVKKALGFWKRNEVNSVAIFGIEAHICVLQSCLDLLDNGFEVFIIVDGVSSMRNVDRNIALKRLALMERIHITTLESFTYQLLLDSNHPSFKVITSIMKEHNSKERKLGLF